MKTEVIVTIMEGSADAGSGENKYEGEAHIGFGFNPPELTIEKGTIVKWVNNDSSFIQKHQANQVVIISTAFDSSCMNLQAMYIYTNLITRKHMIIIALCILS